MDKKIAGLLGAVAGLATVGAAQAAVPAAGQPDSLQASSYADLLAPVPNAVEALKADNARTENAAQASMDGVELAQYYYYYPYYRYHHHHHHHHHHRYYRHHHHHHHHSSFIGIPGVGGVVIR